MRPPLARPRTTVRIDGVQRPARRRHGFPIVADRAAELTVFQNFLVPCLPRLALLLLPPRRILLILCAVPVEHGFGLSAGQPRPAAGLGKARELLLRDGEVLGRGQLVRLRRFRLFGFPRIASFRLAALGDAVLHPRRGVVLHGGVQSPGVFGDAVLRLRRASAFIHTCRCRGSVLYQFTFQGLNLPFL